MKELIKWLFKYRNFSYKRFTLYLFPRTRYEISIGIDTDGWVLFFINFIFISIEFEFAPDEYYNPSQETLDHIKMVKGLTEKEKHELAIKNILKSFKDEF